MTGYVSVGKAANFELRNALLIYGRTGGREDFVTQHEAIVGENSAPRLGPGRLLQAGFIESLIRGLRGVQLVEILPENVLVRTPDRIVWWVPPAIRVMFYALQNSPELASLSGKAYPQPALLFDAKTGKLSIRALKSARRPNKDTNLFRAPYWNVYDNGSVCLGSTRVPKAVGVGTMLDWELAFFSSEFSHQNSRERLTTHPKGFVPFWRGLAGKKVFPTRYLADAKETLREFLKSDCR